MTQCWSEGALRAYLDRELSPEEIQQVAAHLKQCSACDDHCRELAARATRVSALIDYLPELEAETLHVPARLPRRQSARPRVGWVGAAVALAAGLGIAAYVIPRPRETPVVVAVTVPSPAPPVETVVPLLPAPEEVPRLAVRPVRSAPRRAVRPVSDAGDFVALDDEPFESGVIMRVAVTPGKTQADIVFGPDGRARAFRLVPVSAPSAKQKF
jgi:anti-sigma factor RsiW